jgi:hypothetical protein
MAFTTPKIFDPLMPTGLISDSVAVNDQILKRSMTSAHIPTFPISLPYDYHHVPDFCLAIRRTCYFPAYMFLTYVWPWVELAISRILSADVGASGFKWYYSSQLVLWLQEKTGNFIDLDAKKFVWILIRRTWQCPLTTVIWLLRNQNNRCGEFRDQGDAKWIVIRWPLRGPNNTPSRLISHPGVDRFQGIFGGFRYY